MVSWAPEIVICVLDTGKSSAIAAPQEIRVMEDPESNSARDITDFLSGPVRVTLLVIISTSGICDDWGAAALVVAAAGELLLGVSSHGWHCCACLDRFRTDSDFDILWPCGRVPNSYDTIAVS